MGDRFGRCPHGCDAGVAAPACRVALFENTAGVTTIATYIGMCSIELETGAEVIKSLLRTGNLASQ
jgi:hypothetical protein